MAILCLLKHDGTLDCQWEVDGNCIVIGRGAAVDAQIEDEGLSRRHFVVYGENGDYWIRDLSSRNGTWVDGRRIQTILLQHEDRIVAGQTQFCFSETNTREVSLERTKRGPHDTVVIPSE